ncbi:UDP-N-acetylmuramoyl-L-alanine--D-glutamate ligase [Deinococcus sonorensis]|uniref:UDP-N-acetylmuramoylalanine--D-glutamate ligase n=2 Tax=Deinococcus sonorensis TaxID=309891 RepID=A0AAU7UBF0_9DEIO
MTVYTVSTLIYGLGRSGRGVARFLARSGETAEWLDARPQPQDLALMTELGFSQGQLDRPYRQVIAAPGVPIDHPDLEQLRAQGAEVIGEAELAFRARPGLPMVGITGTAGKGSTTVLVADLLRACGLRAREGGNIDPPLLDVVDDADVVVVELSSFQLERVVQFRPAVAVITNLGTDHLDRHRTLAAYHQAKLAITARQTSDDLLILPVGLDVPTRAQVQHADPAQLRLSGGQRVLDAGTLPQGIHPANAAAALLAAEGLLRQLGQPVDLPLLRSALLRARPVKGRFETVAQCGGLRFINDSIATRTLAVQAALEQAAPPIVWLVGGRDKGAELDPLREAARGRVVQVVGFGEDGERFARQLELPYVLAGGVGGEQVMREAVRLAVETLSQQRDPRGTVLLSPIGTSFDLYRDYTERGEAFTRAALDVVEALEAAVRR